MIMFVGNRFDIKGGIYDDQRGRQNPRERRAVLPLIVISLLNSNL